MYTVDTVLKRIGIIKIDSNNCKFLHLLHLKANKIIDNLLKLPPLAHSFLQKLLNLQCFLLAHHRYNFLERRFRQSIHRFKTREELSRYFWSDSGNFGERSAHGCFASFVAVMRNSKPMRLVAQVLNDLQRFGSF